MCIRDRAIGAAFGGFAAFIGGLIGDAFTSAKEYFEGKIEEDVYKRQHWIRSQCKRQLQAGWIPMPDR